MSDSSFPLIFDTNVYHFSALSICQDGSFRGEAYVAKYEQLENFLSLLTCRTVLHHDKVDSVGDTDLDDGLCCICYACEADAQIAPCSHRSCYGCITRHLLNCQRCFFCNATVTDVSKIG